MSTETKWTPGAVVVCNSDEWLVVFSTRGTTLMETRLYWTAKS